MRRPGFRLLVRLLPALVLLALAGVALGRAGDRDPAPSARHTAAAPAPPAPATPVAVGGREAGRTGLGAPPRIPEKVARRYFHRTSSAHVAADWVAGFAPLYREAARRFGVNWRLIASVHRQETAFSTAPGTYHGRNFLGCCAGPMQFNVTNGPVSTWVRFRDAFRYGRRPRRYPHRTARHPSIYDDFDAIMAAAWLLRTAGAGTALDGSAWSAAYSYYGHDAFGVRYADEVMARALGWARDGFCINCAVDPKLVAAQDAAYGKAARAALHAGRRKHRKHKHKHRHKHRHGKQRHGHRKQSGRRGAHRPAAERKSTPPPAPKRTHKPAADPAPTTTTTTPAQTQTTTTPPASTTPTTTSTTPAPSPPAPPQKKDNLLCRLNLCG